MQKDYLWSNILQSANEAAGKCSRMRCPLEYDLINFQHLLNWLEITPMTIVNPKKCKW